MASFTLSRTACFTGRTQPQGSRAKTSPTPVALKRTPKPTGQDTFNLRADSSLRLSALSTSVKDEVVASGRSGSEVVETAQQILVEEGPGAEMCRKFQDEESQAKLQQAFELLAQPGPSAAACVINQEDGPGAEIFKMSQDEEARQGMERAMELIAQPGPSAVYFLMNQEGPGAAACRAVDPEDTETVAKIEKEFEQMSKDGPTTAYALANMPGPGAAACILATEGPGAAMCKIVETTGAQQGVQAAYNLLAQPGPGAAYFMLNQEGPSGAAMRQLGEKIADQDAIDQMQKEFEFVSSTGPSAAYMLLNQPGPSAAHMLLNEPGPSAAACAEMGEKDN